MATQTSELQSFLLGAHFGREISESVLLSEEIEFSVTPFAEQTPEFQSFLLRAHFGREISESVLLSEEIEFSARYGISEFMLLSEEVEFSVTPFAEQTPELQSFLLRAHFGREISESVLLSEEIEFSVIPYVGLTPELQSFLLRAHFGREISESVQFSEEVEFSVIPYVGQTPELQSFLLRAHFGREISESVQFSEEVEFSVAPTEGKTPKFQSLYLQAQYDAEISESVQLSEEVAVFVVMIQESISFSETVIPIATSYFEINETVLFSEEVELIKLGPSRTPHLHSLYLQAKLDREIEESVLFSEEVNVLLLKIEEVIQLSETIDSISTYYLGIDETVLFSEEIEAKSGKTPKLLSFWLYGTQSTPSESIYLSENIEIWTNGFLSLSDSVQFFEEIISYRKIGISEEVLLDETLSIKTRKLLTEEELCFSEEITLKITRINLESILFSEELLISPCALSELFELEEALSFRLTLHFEDSILFSESVELQILKSYDEEFQFSEIVEEIVVIPEKVLVEEEIKFSEETEEAIRIGSLISEEIFLSEEIDTITTGSIGVAEEVVFSESLYLSRLSLSESLKLGEHVQQQIIRQVFESLEFSDLVDARIAKICGISEQLHLEEISESITTCILEIDEKIVLSEVLQKEIHIYIGPGQPTRILLEENFIFSEKYEVSIAPVELISEQIIFSEDVDLTSKAAVPTWGGDVRGIVAVPKPIEVVFYPTAKAPPVIKRAYPTAKAPPIIKRAYPSAKPAPLPRRVPPAVAPKISIEAPAPPKVRTERRKAKIVRIRITDNSSRYRVK